MTKPRTEEQAVKSCIIERIKMRYEQWGQGELGTDSWLRERLNRIWELPPIALLRLATELENGNPKSTCVHDRASSIVEHVYWDTHNDQEYSDYFGRNA